MRANGRRHIRAVGGEPMEDEKDAAAHEQQKSRTDKIVELLRDSEKSAGELVTALGLEQSNVSQHLARLREKHILIARKQGIGVFYSVRDPKLFQVLDLLPEYFYEHLGEIQQIMRQL